MPPWEAMGSSRNGEYLIARSPACLLCQPGLLGLQAELHCNLILCRQHDELCGAVRIL